MTTQSYIYEKAFDRNIGWLTPEEQSKLRTSCVAIAGVGGAGGFQAQVLARLGVGKFKIADPDRFEMSNINRQIGASISTLGQSKTEVIRRMILDINPEADVQIFPEGISSENIREFLSCCDLVVDGIDFFALELKLLLFETSYQMKLTAITSCPLGFGASLIIFSPEGMKYDEYFDIKDGMNESDKRMALTYGLSPSPLCLKYMGKQALQVKNTRSASVSPGLTLVGALTGTEAVKILTKKWPATACPYIFQMDMMTSQVRKKYFPMGMRSPWQRFKKWIIKNFILKGSFES